MVTTREVVTEFLRIKLEQRNYTVWLEHKPKDQSRKRKDKTINNDVQNNEELNKICKLLDGVSNDLLEFIKRDKKQFNMFYHMIDDLMDNFDRRNFIALADEVFSRGVCWGHVVTILVMAMEFSRNAQEVDINLVVDADNSSIDSIIARRGEMVWELIDWICRYFAHDVDPWIQKQPGEWFGVKELQNINSGSYFKQYFGMMAVGIVAGTLYMCSKF